jgi:hypothetical protein
MATQETIFRILTLLTAEYPEKEVTPETPGLYEALLIDVPDEVLEAAVLDHISKSKWYPKISELRDIAIDMQTGTSRLPPAAEAWGTAYKAMVEYGRSRKPDFDNPVLEQTIKALGWRNLCMSTNPIADRARFIQAYDQYKERNRVENVTLPGIKALAEKLQAPGLPAGHIRTEDSEVIDEVIND